MTQKHGKLKGAYLRNAEVDRAANRDRPLPAWVLPILILFFLGVSFGILWLFVAALRWAM